jgi:GDPmannose 4,6-dehydratase
MLQQKQPDDYVIATGEAHSVRDLVELAFAAADLDWERHVEIDRRYFRPTEVDALRGDPTKALSVLGWAPRVTFRELGKMMVRHDIDLARRERAVNEAGFADRPEAPPRPLTTESMEPPTRFPLSGRRIFVAGHRGMVGSGPAG